MANCYEVIIVGAGPAGASLAARLAKAGRQVLLVDQGAFPRSKICGECLAAGAWRQLAELGLDKILSHRCGKPAAVSIVAPGGRSVELALHPTTHESIVTISRFELDRALVEHAAHCGAELLLEHRLRRVLGDCDGASGIEVSPTTAARPHRQLRCRMLIAADGRHSQIVRATGQVRGRGPKLVGFKTHLPASASGAAADAVAMHSFAGGYLGVCRVENGLTNICGLLPPSALRATRGSVPRALQALLGESVNPIAERLLAAENWQTIAGVRQQTATPSMPGVFYIGDAQGTIEPLAGQGIAMALESAALAAKLLLPRAAIDGDLQQNYQAEWRRRYRAAISRASLLGWLLRHPRVLTALVGTAPLPRGWKRTIAHHGYTATRLAPC
jgi:flavin-dependent dehydrogenase